MSAPAAARAVEIGETSPDPGGLLRWPIKLLVPIAFFLLALQGVANTLTAIAVLRGRNGA